MVLVPDYKFNVDGVRRNHRRVKKHIAPQQDDCAVWPAPGHMGSSSLCVPPPEQTVPSQSAKLAEEREAMHLAKSVRAAAIVATTAISLLFCAGAAMANPAHVRIAGPLQSGPAVNAPATGTLKAGALVDIVERKGFWAHVRSGAASGWLKLSRLSMDSGGAGNEIAALASGRTGSGNVVSASGGRGLDAADFARATPDPASVSALSRIAASEASAEQFARSGRLQTRRIDYIREPKTAAGRGQR